MLPALIARIRAWYRQRTKPPPRVTAGVAPAWMPRDDHRRPAGQDAASVRRPPSPVERGRRLSLPAAGFPDNPRYRKKTLSRQGAVVNRVFRRFLPCLALLLTPHAHAEVFKVGTDVHCTHGTLAAALAAAVANGPDLGEIRLTVDVQTTQARFTITDSDVLIAGGWTPCGVALPGATARSLIVGNGHDAVVLRRRRQPGRTAPVGDHQPRSPRGRHRRFRGRRLDMAQRWRGGAARHACHVQSRAAGLSSS